MWICLLINYIMIQPHNSEDERDYASFLQQNNYRNARTQMEHRNNEYSSPPYTRRRLTNHDDRQGEGNIEERKRNSPVLQWRAKSPVLA
ncbi:hypothetical protein YC2023_084334 [Brassica napus]